MTDKPVVKIALPTKSITSTNLRDFAFHSDYSSIKIYQKGADTVTVSASSSATETITHSVGFFPLAQLYVELTPSSGRWYAAPFFTVSGEDTYVSGDFTDGAVTATTAVFKIYNNTASQKVVNYYYYIIGDDGK